MAEASNIGANFSSYEGNAGLGGGSLGFFKLDTRPLEDFARYTMLYNKAEYDQRQKDAEKAAEELGKIADYDLTTSIQKDAKVLQEKYDKLTSYVKQNPNALQYKNREQWLEYQRLKNDLSNDIRGAKTRNIMNLSRQKEISEATDEADKKRLTEDLTKEIEAKDIRTPLLFTQQYDTTIPDFGKNQGQSIVVNKWLGNQITQDTTELFDNPEALRKGAAFSLGADFDTSSTTGKLKEQKFKNNFYVKGADLLNQAVANAATGIDPNLSDADKELAIKSKLSGIGIMKNIDAYNDYMAQKQKEIAANFYTDRNRKKINPEDYKPINWADGLSPQELYAVVEFTNWAGDKQDTKIIQTNDAIERARIGLGYANLDLDRQKMLSSQTEDLISADAVVREVQDAIKMATPLNITVGGKVVRQVKQIADPNLLKEFGTIDKDGNVSNVPDMVTYDPKDNQLSLIYHDKKKNDAGVFEVVKGETGNPKVEREIKLNPTQWIGQITKRKNPNKDIGGVNAIVEQIYTNNGRNLVELAENYGGQNAVGSTKKKTTESSSSTTLSESPADWKKEGNNWRYKDGTLYDSKGNIIKK
jgi:hypothetical protein